MPDKTMKVRLQEVESKSRTALLAIIGECTAEDTFDEEDYAAIVRLMLLSGFTSVQIAKKFDLSSYDVQRWIQGRSIPQPYVRGACVETLASMLRERDEKVRTAS